MSLARVTPGRRKRMPKKGPLYRSLGPKPVPLHFGARGARNAGFRLRLGHVLRHSGSGFLPVLF